MYALWFQEAILFWKMLNTAESNASLSFNDTSINKCLLINCFSLTAYLCIAVADLNRDRMLLSTLELQLSSVSPFWLLSFSGRRNGILKLWAQLDTLGNCASLSKKLLTLHCLAHYRWQSREKESETGSKERMRRALGGWEVLEILCAAWVSQKTRAYIV